MFELLQDDGEKSPETPHKPVDDVVFTKPPESSKYTRATLLALSRFTVDQPPPELLECDEYVRSRTMQYPQLFNEFPADVCLAHVVRPKLQLWPG